MGIEASPIRNFGTDVYPEMLSSFEFCLTTKAASVPDRPNWLHEVTCDGYRLTMHSR